MVESEIVVLVEDFDVVVAEGLGEGGEMDCEGAFWVGLKEEVRSDQNEDLGVEVENEAW